MTTPAADAAEHFYADMRRAAALLAHFAANDHAGVNALLDEAEELGRLRPLAYAIPAVMGGIQNGWHTEQTAAVLRSFTDCFGMREHEGRTDG